MISFLLCLAILIVGYFVYGKIVDNTFGPDDRETPAVRINDGVDYVVMPQWKLFLVQLLNIAGLGPIFGAMQGALWGPVVFLWITFGTIFAGGVHDYFSGMMSERNDGASIAEITGKYLGPVMQNVMRVFSVVLLIMVGTVFAVGPAGLIVELCHQSGASGVLTSLLFWLIIILVYYFIATFISIDAVIGKIYPIFGICLIIMAIGVIFGIFTNPAYTIPEIWDHFGSMHPSGTPIWSFMFITVACGAISGFHSTQSPLMARCMKSEKQGHFVFYGAMVCEGVIALIWAAAGCGPDQSDNALAHHCAVEHEVALLLTLHAAGHQGRLSGVEAGDSAACNGDEHEAPDRGARRMHAAKVIPDLRDGVGGVGKDAKDNADGHDDQADAKDGVDLADDRIDGDKGCNKVVHQNDDEPEQQRGEHAGSTALMAQLHDQACGTYREHGANHDEQNDGEHAHDVLHHRA